MSVGTTTPAAGENTKVQGTTLITCDPSLDISLVQSLRGRFQEALQAQCPVMLDAAQVERVDTAVLQLLCAFFQEAHARGIAVHWQQPSLALQHAAQLLDLTRSLVLPIENIDV